jgi:RNA polymerase sigma-70 factor (ECF subfamily)
MDEGVEREVERLVQTYADTVLRVALVRLGSAADAQDLCQTVFVKLWTLRRHGALSFADAEHEKAWVIRTTLNACEDLRRDGYRSRVVGEGVPERARDGDPVWERVALSERAAEVLRAVLDLPEAQRVAVYLRYYEGLNVRAVAKACGTSTAAVEMRLARAKAALRGRLKEVAL